MIPFLRLPFCIFYTIIVVSDAESLTNNIKGDYHGEMQKKIVVSFVISIFGDIDHTVLMFGKV